MPQDTKLEVVQNQEPELEKTKTSRRERGFTLLEYCAGAAVLIAVVYVGMDAFGQSLSAYFVALGTWLTNHQPK